MVNMEFIKLLKKSWAKRKQFEKICFTARLSNEECEWFDPHQDQDQDQDHNNKVNSN
jgi:hypothetical protein